MGSGVASPAWPDSYLLALSYPNYVIDQTGGQFEAFLDGGSEYPAGLSTPLSDSLYTLVVDANGTGKPQGMGVTQSLNGNVSFRSQGANSETLSTNTITSGALFNWNPLGGASYYEGNLRALIVYNRVLSDTEIQEVQDYLNERYGLTNNHPVQNIVFDGDSLTAGFQGTGQPKGYTDQVLVNQTHPFKAYNLGIKGQLLSTMLTNASSKIDPLYDNSLSRNVDVIWGGTNDINSGADPTTVYNNLVAYCLARKARGYKVIVLTMLPRGTSTSFETNRQIFNMSVRDNWSTFADGLVDIGNDLTLGSVGAQNNTTYYSGDKIHLTAAGDAIVATAVSDALEDIPFANSVTNSVVSSSSSNSPAAPSCSDSKPEKSPQLFQIETTKDKATLYFSPSGKNTSSYFIAYGYDANDNRFGTQFDYGKSDGAMEYTINDLEPNKTYYFKVRAGNGCATGDWSNTLHAATLPKDNTFGTKIFTAWEEMRDLVMKWMKG